MIGNPPYVESRNSRFSENLKDLLQKQIQNNYTQEDRKCFPRGADLLIFFFELSFRLLNLNGINAFITENSWLSTDYGKKFQQYLLKNIDVRGIIDSDYKYFETADINTIISFFKKNSQMKESSIRFFHCHENLEIHPCNIINPDNNDFSIEYNTIPCNSSLLNKYKWGFIYSTDTKLINLLESMYKIQNKDSARKISIGQGLNITKDKILRSESSMTTPYFISETGSLYAWTEAKTFVLRSVVSRTKRNPLLILPRGLGTHFCCMNEIGGYSSSYVEIYENMSLTESEKLNLWLFCNSSLLWLLREYTGRCNLGGGMLKAEAADLKSIPLCFAFENHSEIKAIYSLGKSQRVPSKIEDAISSEVHKRIDKIVFEYFGIPVADNFVIDMLVSRFNWRNKKSRNT